MIAPERLLLDVANRRRLSLDVVEAVIAGELEGGVDVAPHVSLTLADPNGELLGSDVLVRNAIRTLGEPEAKALRAIDVALLDDHYRLAQASARDGDQTSQLTLEARPVAYMRQHTAPLLASRGKVTRAQFIRRQVEEVGRNARRVNGRRIRATTPIAFWAPQIRLRPPLAPLSAEDRRQLRGDAEDGRDVSARSRTARDAKGLTVKGKPATLEQRRNMAHVLEVARGEKGATPKVLLALFCAIPQESEWKNLEGGHDSSVGILQLLDLHGPVALRRDVAHCVRKFIGPGFRGPGTGAAAVAKANPGIAVPELCARVQGNRRGAVDYAPHLEEARRNLEALGGADGAAAGDDVYVRRYAFQREAGVDGWTSTGQLAEEVKWLRFLVGNTVIFAPAEALFRLPARMRLSPDHPAVSGFDYDLDYGRTAREATLTVSGAEWRVPWGQPIVLEDADAATGKWLVWNVRRGFWEDDVTVTLRQPHDVEPEPRAELGQRADRSDRSPSSSSTGGGGGATGDLQWPVRGPVTSPYGPRWGRLHDGIDIGVPIGTACRAADGGRVVEARNHGSGYGNYVEIDHGAVSTFYGHLDSIAVRAGQSVSQGQLIGRTGNTGSSTGPHLHFGAKRGDTSIDPRPLL